MIEKFNRGWTLAVLSFRVLQQNRQLLVFPLITFASMALVFASFAVPGWPLIAGYFEDALSTAQQTRGLVILFLFYWINYTIITFFNVALMHATLETLAGREASLKAGLSRALSLWAPILGYSAIAATVGMILRAIEERVGWIGQIVVGLIGFAWTVSVALVVPVLAEEGIGPFEAIRRSGGLIRKTWGEGLVSAAGIAAFTSAIIGIVILIGAATGIGLAVNGMVPAGITVGVFTVFTVAVLILVQETLGKINLAVLYRYASTGETSGYDQSLLIGAYRQKKKK